MAFAVGTSMANRGNLIAPKAPRTPASRQQARATRRQLRDNVQCRGDSRVARSWPNGRPRWLKSGAAAVCEFMGPILFFQPLAAAESQRAAHRIAPARKCRKKSA